MQDHELTLAREAFQAYQLHLHGETRSVEAILAAQRRVLDRRSSYAFGIDFGTTNSAVAFWGADDCVVVPSSTGEETTPSIMAPTPAGEWLVGRAAKPKRHPQPGQHGSVGEAAPRYGVDAEVYGRTYTAVEVAAIILGELRAQRRNTRASGSGPS